MNKAWYQTSPEECLDILESSECGLSQEAAKSRLLETGPNEISFKKKPAWKRFLAQFNDPMVAILLITGVTTSVLTLLGSNMFPETVVIFGVVLLNAILGFVQEGKAEGALDALRKMMVQESRIIRDGEQRRLPARELVPGDIVLLESGDKVPADIRLIDAANFHVDESSLTGESIPTKKTIETLSKPDLVPGDQKNMCFSGTYITQGAAKAIVTNTGNRTVFGRIADMVKTADSGATPLQVKMKEFVRSLIIAILIVGAFNFGYGIFLNYDITYSFLGSVSLVVAAIPAMLPALVTSILALSSVVMASRKALIRKLPAAETLGATSVICSDKTGTLTENKMTVTKIYAGGEIYDVGGTGYQIEGGFLKNGEPIDYCNENQLLNALSTGFYCNNASLTGDSGEGGTGDPTEIALRVSGTKAGFEVEGVKRLEEIPFDSSEKYMAVLVSYKGKQRILVKGAPEVILPMCDHELTCSGEKRELDLEQLHRQANTFASEALRTLGFAYKEVDEEHPDLNRQSLEGMTLAGFQGMIDPAKESAIEAVGLCKKAGIRTVMITGDHPDTALAVSKQLGITSPRAVTGSELSNMNHDELMEVVTKVSVFARVAPEHKKDIAEALREHGHVVAMTGDGVNDAPALKAADIGVAMGVTGTEVAKEASDMVLADDNFATIVAAVEEGRHAWKNLQKAILYTLPTNAAQALLIIGAIIMASYLPIFGVRFVLEPVQILWVNLLDSVLLTMPLMMQKKENGLLNDPPRDSRAHIIDSLFIQRLVIMGLAIALPGFAIYYHFGTPALVNGELADPLLLTQAQTAAFWAILLGHFGYVISVGSIDKSAFTFKPLRNKWLVGGIILSILIRCIPTVIPEASTLFRTAPFPVEWWPLILLCFFPSFIAIELDKLVRNTYNKKVNQPPKEPDLQSA